MMASYLLNEHEIKEIIAKKFNTSTDKIFITADESGKIIVKVDYNVALFNDKCRIIGQYNERGISWGRYNFMKNKFHRHRYKIIGTGHDQNRIEVDLMCKCGKHGTVLVEKCFEKRILDQAAKGKYFSVPRIICVLDE